jgi:hypothetical protein
MESHLLLRKAFPKLALVHFPATLFVLRQLDPRIWNALLTFHFSSAAASSRSFLGPSRCFSPFSSS